MACEILVVDDSATTRAMIKRTIGLSGLANANVHEAGDGKAALAVLRSKPIDLVLADLHMPEMDGVELTRNILADSKLSAIPVVIVSAEPNIQRIAELKRQGVRGHVRKPFTPESIRDVIQSLLNRAA